MSAVPVSGQVPDSASASLTGVIRDSTGAAIAGADVILTGTTRATRSDDAGRFTLPGVTPGAYRVWFRRLGYSSAQFDWAARTAERTEVNVVLNRIPRTLDPVVVRAQEDKELSDRASILGIVVDTAGQPI
ncbi:MAG TPA: carboxypeptidase-like regulatory domain-containing protein, partial [Gemmatimonadaceae bacterium]